MEWQATGPAGGGDLEVASSCCQKEVEDMVSLLQRLPAMAFGLLSLIFTATVVPATEGAPENVRDWEKLWTHVLAKNVNETGQIDFASLSRNRADLDRVVAFIAANDPVSRPAKFPGREARLAYYINAYNALAMYGVVDAGIPDSFGGFRKFTFFYLRTFTIGGKSISLYDFENDVIRPIGEPRIHFALNCMVVGCPRLPRMAFTADKLEMQLDVAARTFIGESRNLRVNMEKRELWLSEIFKFYTKDFVAREPSLVAYVNRYRSDKISADFVVRYLNYDWTVNKRKTSGK